MFFTDLKIVYFKKHKKQSDYLVDNTDFIYNRETLTFVQLWNKKFCERDMNFKTNIK